MEKQFPRIARVEFPVPDSISYLDAATVGDIVAGDLDRLIGQAPWATVEITERVPSIGTFSSQRTFSQ